MYCCICFLFHGKDSGAGCDSVKTGYVKSEHRLRFHGILQKTAVIQSDYLEEGRCTMKKQVFNPFLPGYEYVPDGEPHVFDGRVYLYGSHDRFDAPMFCMNDYVCWSAPVDDLSDWRYEGVIYSKKQDPKNKLGLRLLFAPDAAQGPDGRYYLYYALDFMGIMGVAVCNTPAGMYEFLGYVRYPDGTIWGRKKGDQFPFDPGVLVDEDGRVYLYSGFYKRVPAISTGFKKLRNDGGVVLELEQDMVTIKQNPKVLFPKQGDGSFRGHEFFEASSIRKYDGKYYFVYSSVHNHELCYAVSDWPTEGFCFGKTLVSLGDLFLGKRMKEEQGVNYLGNTHGGLLNVGNKWYIFYHRQTNRHSYSRQACAEQLVRKPDGSFVQAEVTSCGLNEGPLIGNGKYGAGIACNLWSKTGVGRYDCKHSKKVFAEHPYITQSGSDREDNGDQYIANMRDGAVAGFKYFRTAGVRKAAVFVRGKAEGMMVLSDVPDFARIWAEIPVKADSGQTISSESRCRIPDGEHALYFKFEGIGSLDFIAFELSGEVNDYE